MDFDANTLFASFVVGGIGFVCFVYGKKQARVPQMLAGVILCVYPYFVSNVWLMLAIAAAVLGALWGAVRLGW